MTGIVRSPHVRRALSAGILLAAAGFSGCGASDEPPASAATATTVTTDPGPSPFISLVHITGCDPSTLVDVEYTIAPKPGSASSPVHVEYSIPALRARGYINRGRYGLVAEVDASSGAVSAYAIDPASMIAQVVDYAVADDETRALLVGLDPDHNVTFEFAYPTFGCKTSWNARPISLGDLVIDR
ncbi:MAG: hypothetical protein ACREUT_09155 [Steroidobacteraceae bacterium]